MGRGRRTAYGGQIVELQLAGHYVCRPRNNKEAPRSQNMGAARRWIFPAFASPRARSSRCWEVSTRRCARPIKVPAVSLEPRLAQLGWLSRRSHAFRHSEPSQRRLLPLRRGAPRRSARRRQRIAQFRRWTKRQRAKADPAVFHHRIHLQLRRIAAFRGEASQHAGQQPGHIPARSRGWRPAGAAIAATQRRSGGSSPPHSR